MPDEEAGARSVADIRPLADNGSAIDVMVVYTGAALAGYGSEGRANAVFDMVVAGTNQAFRNSSINTSIRLVHTVAVEYAETGHIGDR